MDIFKLLKDGIIINITYFASAFIGMGIVYMLSLFLGEASTVQYITQEYKNASYILYLFGVFHMLCLLGLVDIYMKVFNKWDAKIVVII